MVTLQKYVAFSEYMNSNDLRTSLFDSTLVLEMGFVPIPYFRQDQTFASFLPIDYIQIDQVQ